MFLVALNRYAVALALVVLGLSGCSSPQKSIKGSSTPNTDSMSASAKKLEQDFSQTESDFSKLEGQVQLKK